MKYVKPFQKFNEELFGGLFGKKEESPAKDNTQQSTDLNQKVSQVFPGLTDKLDTQALKTLGTTLDQLFFDKEITSQQLGLFSILNSLSEGGFDTSKMEGRKDNLGELKKYELLLTRLINLFRIVETGTIYTKDGIKVNFPLFDNKEKNFQLLGKFLNSDSKFQNASELLSKLYKSSKEGKEANKVLDSIKTLIK